MRRCLAVMRVAYLRVRLAITVVQRCLSLIRLVCPVYCGVFRRRCGEIVNEELDKYSAKVDAHYGHYGHLAIVPVIPIVAAALPECLHVRVSGKGSNHHKMRRTCLDCGHLRVTNFWDGVAD